MNYYRTLLTLRRSSPALQQGSYRTVSQSGEVYAYERAGGDQRCLIALNFASRPASIKIDGEWQVRLSSVERSAAQVNGALTLAANEALILEQRLS